MNPDRTLPWDWYAGRVPDNVTLHDEAYLETTYSFQLFRSRASEAVRIGRGSSIYLGVMFDLGPQARVNIGDFTLMNGTRIICDTEISIGDYCLISWNTVLMDTYRVPRETDARHRELELVPTRTPRQAAADVPARPIHIGRNVWIGFDSCVLPGVTIGEGSIVGARSVVVEDVPPFTVVVGNPARAVRQLDPSEPRDLSEMNPLNT
jgi:acetyltransferase-like isoleucine patch superfamily enzyme